jgi:hypothetical protein
VATPSGPPAGTPPTGQPPADASDQTGSNPPAADPPAESLLNALSLKDLADQDGSRYGSESIQPTPAPGPADLGLAILLASLEQTQLQGGG